MGDITAADLVLAKCPFKKCSCKTRTYKNCTFKTTKCVIELQVNLFLWNDLSKTTYQDLSFQSSKCLIAQRESFQNCLFKTSPFEKCPLKNNKCVISPQLILFLQSVLSISAYSKTFPFKKCPLITINGWYDCSWSDSCKVSFQKMLIQDQDLQKLSFQNN